MELLLFVKKKNRSWASKHPIRVAGLHPRVTFLTADRAFPSNDSPEQLGDRVFFSIVFGLAESLGRQSAQRF
jgi:hypothetical protein